MSILLSADATSEEVRREGWLARRRGKVTSTDVPVLFGEGYAGTSRVKLLAQKRGLAPDTTADLRMMIGRWQQATNAQAYEYVTRRKLVMADEYHLHVSEQYPWLATSLDASDSEGALVEMKNHGGWLKDEFDLPGYWYLQTQTQLLVTGRNAIRLSILCAGSDLKIFDVAPNPEVQEEIVKRSREFYDMMMDPTAVPPPETPEDNEAYKYLWTPVPKSSIVLSDDEDWDGLGTERAAFKGQIKELEDKISMIEGRVKFELGEKEVGVTPDGGLWSWAANKNGTRVLRYKAAK